VTDISFGTPCKVSLLVGNNKEFKEFSGVLVSQLSVGTGLKITKDDGVWQTSPVRDIHQCGGDNTYRVTTRNSIYNIEVEHGDPKSYIGPD
jgi:hypothetical protein